MKYVKVEDGVIVDGPRALPASIPEVSNLNTNPALAKQFGWIPVNVIEPTIDTATQYKGARVVTLTDELATITWEVNDLDEIGQARVAFANAEKEIIRLENTISKRWLWSAATGDEFAQGKIAEVEVLLATQRVIRATAEALIPVPEHI
jgi:hypothetical protein